MDKFNNETFKNDVRVKFESIYGGNSTHTLIKFLEGRSNQLAGGVGILSYGLIQSIPVFFIFFNDCYFMKDFNSFCKGDVS